MAIYKSTNLSPSDSYLDARGVNRFSWSVNGAAQTDYQVRIYNNTTGALVHDSTKTTSANEYYDLTGGTLSNGTEYKWNVQNWAGSLNETSEFEFFAASSTPVTNFTSPDFSSPPTSISTQDYTFIASYAQAENISIKKFKFDLYDSTGTTLISTSGDVYNFTVQYEFTGLVNNTTYQIECTVTSQHDLSSSTGKQTFTLSYTLPENVPDLELTPNNTNGSIEVSWASLKQVLGVITGSSNYVSGKFNYGIEVTNGSTLTYSETFDDNSYTFTYWFKLQYGHDGDFMQIGLNKKVGYEASTNRFYFDDNGIITYSGVMTLYTWEDLGSSAWSAFGSYTWADLFGATPTTYSGDWYFLGITSEDMIIKLHNELRAYIDI